MHRKLDSFERLKKGKKNLYFSGADKDCKFGFSKSLHPWRFTSQLLAVVIHT